MRLNLSLLLLTSLLPVAALAETMPPPPPPAVVPAAAAPAVPAPGAPAAPPPSAAGPTSTTMQAPAALNPAPQTADEAFDVRVKTMEEQVNDLKEKIFRTKARLLLLQESVLGGVMNQGAKAVIVHRNEMGSSFVLESVAYTLDSAPIYTKVDVDGDLDKKEEFEIFNGRIIPGQHQIAVKLNFRGHGFGVFSYLEGYKFKVQSSYTFDAEGGKITHVKIVAHEKGGITADLKDRPAVRYDLERSTDAAMRKGGEVTPAKAEDGKK